MNRISTCFLFAFLVLFTFLSAAELSAAPYYQGKVITLICGAEPGGGYDRTARLVSKHLGKFIPGKPTIIVSNMPGAIGTIAANYVYNIAKPNGLTIATFNRGLSFGQLLKAPGVKFDMTKFSWIGSPTVESTVLFIKTNLAYKTFEDLKNAKSPLNIGCTGTTGTDYSFLVLLKEFTGVKFNYVMYPGGSAVNLAIERGEVEARAGSYSSLKNFVTTGLVRPLIRSRVAEPEISNLPVDEDLVTDNKGKILLSMRSAPDLIGRPYVAPPGVAPEVMNILRDAFAKLTKDPEFKKEAERYDMTLNYVTAAKCLETLNFIFKQPPDIVSEFNKYVKF